MEDPATPYLHYYMPGSEDFTHLEPMTPDIRDSKMARLFP